MMEGHPNEDERVDAIVDALRTDDDEVLGALKAPRRRRLAVSIALFALGVGLSLGALRHQTYLQRLVRGEVDVAGEPHYEPPHTVDPEALRAIDWADVHGRLLPAWVIAQGRRSIPTAEREDRAQRAYIELRYALAPDRNLVELLDEVEVGLRRDPLGSAGRVDYLLWAYNHYLDANDVPWRLEATLLMRRDERETPTFLTRSYHVLEDLRSPEGHRLRLLRRADLTNVDEGFLGHTSGRDDGALVMLDRVLQFGVHRVWPLLHAGLDTRLPDRSRGLAEHVRREALGVLDPNDLVLLHETAVDQQALIEVAASIHARSSCGNRFRIYGLPWNGLEAPDQRALVEALGRSQGAECPEVTLGEAARMLGASERLGSTPRLAEAVEGLTTFVARAVSVHELRHVADRRGALCVDCPEGMSRAAQDELSAYLASFAEPGIGYTALLQACSMEPQGEDVSSAPHAQALAIAFGALLPSGCAGEIPSDLYERASAARVRFFGDQSSSALPEELPRRVTLLAR